MARGLGMLQEEFISPHGEIDDEEVEKVFTETDDLETKQQRKYIQTKNVIR